MNIKKIATAIVVGISLVFLAWNIYLNLDQIHFSELHFRLEYILAALVLSLLIYLLNGYSWYLAVRLLGGKVYLGETLRVWFISNLSRLIPGSIWQYPGRVYLSGKQGVPKMVSSSALIVEAVLNLGVGVMVIFTLALLSPLPGRLTIFGPSLMWLLLIAVLVMLLTRRQIFKGTVILLEKITKQKISFRELTIDYRFLVIIIAGFVGQFVLAGLMMFFLVNSLMTVSAASIPLIVAIYTFSWMIGYVVVLAPSGLGVQELSLVALLSFLIPLPLAGVVAIGFRIMLLSVEIFIVTLVLASRKGFKSQPQ